MPRRSKNSTDGAVFTYHERRKMDHGSIRRRLPGVAMKPWDRCALGLSQPKDPVLTPDGVLYEREVILRELLRQREEAREARAEATRERVLEEREEIRRIKEKDRAIVESFEKTQSEVVPQTDRPRMETPAGQVRSGSADTNFWVPNIPAQLPVPDEKHSVTKKRKGKLSLKTRCPISKKVLRSKDLISLKFTLNVIGKKENSSQSTSPASKHMCPVCQVVLVNVVKPVALRTGSVLCSRCVAQFVMKEGKDPCTSDNIDVEADVIPIFNAGTAFVASAGDDPSSHEVSVYRPSAT